MRFCLLWLSIVWGEYSSSTETYDTVRGENSEVESCSCSSKNLNRENYDTPTFESIERVRVNEIGEIETEISETYNINGKEKMVYVEGGKFYMGTRKPMILRVFPSMSWDAI